MAGLLIVGLLCNLAVRPVDENATFSKPAEMRVRKRSGSSRRADATLRQQHHDARACVAVGRDSAGMGCCGYDSERVEAVRIAPELEGDARALDERPIDLGDRRCVVERGRSNEHVESVTGRTVKRYGRALNLAYTNGGLVNDESTVRRSRHDRKSRNRRRGDRGGYAIGRRPL